MLYGMFPWWNTPAPAPFPILPPVTAGCTKCCGQHKSVAENVAIVEREYSYVEFIEPYTWLIEEDAPADNYTAQVQLGQVGYKRYVDSVPCGDGAPKAKAYLILQPDENGKLEFKADVSPAEIGLSIPMLALAEGGTITAQGPYTGDTVTVVELKGTDLYRVYTVRNRGNSTLQQLLNTLGLNSSSKAVVYDGTQKVRLQGFTKNGLSLSLGRETWDTTRASHTAIVGAP